jgi:hypothetical protein
VLHAARVILWEVGAKMVDGSETRVFVWGTVVMVVAAPIALWRIKEPPIFHPAKQKFNLLAPIRVAARISGFWC